MKVQLIYLLIISILGMISVFCFAKAKVIGSPNKIRFKKNRYANIKRFINDRIQDDSVSNILRQSGVKITLIQYQIIRYLIFIVWIILYIFLYVILKDSYSFNSLLLILFLFILSSPKKYLLNKKTPFKHVLDIIIFNNKLKQNVEVYGCISQLKNIAITKKKSSFSSDFILEQLGKFTNKTKPIFNKTIALWSLGEKEEACIYFESAVNTNEAKMLANIFRKLDDLTPNELYNHISLLQESMRKERETNKLLANENRNNLIYFIVIATSVLIMLNFVVIVYYLESINNLQLFY